MMIESFLIYSFIVVVGYLLACKKWANYLENYLDKMAIEMWNILGIQRRLMKDVL